MSWGPGAGAPRSSPLGPNGGSGGGGNERFVCTTAPLFFSAFSCRPNATFCPWNPGFCQLGKLGFGKGKNERFVCTTALFFSAFSCRRNATFCPCNPGFCPFWFSPFDVFSLQTLCFFERARRFAATDGNPSFFRASATFSCLCRKTIVFFWRAQRFLDP